MANEIIVKRSAVAGKVPTTTDLALGEIAVNTYDGKMYIKKDDGTASVIQVGGAGGGDVSSSSTSSTDNSIARFDGTTGKLIQNSTVTLDDNGNLANTNSVQFDTTPTTPPTTEGGLYWNSDLGGLAVVMAGGDVVQEIGESQYVYARASSAITKGQVIMFTGAVGGSGIPTGAPATGITDGSYIIGIAAESIALNEFGLIQTFGVLKPVDTTGFSEGTILWYDPSVTGGFTSTKPSAPNVKVQLAAVVSGNSSGGAILIRVTSGSELGSTDSNVSFTSLVGGNLLAYDQTNQYWKNILLTDGTGISVSETTGGVITITNTAPDQTVSISGTSPVSVTGTYPNFTVSMTQASGSVNGWLSSTDWTSFNEKLSLTGGTLTGDLLAPNLLPPTDNTGVVGNSTNTWSNGQFTNMTIDSTLNVRAAIDLADNDVLRFGSSDDWEFFHNGTGNYIDLNVGNLIVRDSTTTRFTFEKTTGNFTATGNITANTFNGALSGTATNASGVSAGVVTGKIIYNTFTATASQTTFTATNTYTSGKIEVFCNGVKMRNGSDVTVTSGTSVVFASGLTAGDLVDLVYPI
jgi:hypothetical protein